MGCSAPLLTKDVLIADQAARGFLQASGDESGGRRSPPTVLLPVAGALAALGAAAVAICRSAAGLHRRGRLGSRPSLASDNEGHVITRFAVDADVVRINEAGYQVLTAVSQ